MKTLFICIMRSSGGRPPAATYCWLHHSRAWAGVVPAVCINEMMPATGLTTSSRAKYPCQVVSLVFVGGLCPTLRAEGDYQCGWGRGKDETRAIEHNGRGKTSTVTSADVGLDCCRCSCLCCCSCSHRLALPLRRLSEHIRLRARIQGSPVRISAEILGATPLKSCGCTASQQRLKSGLCGSDSGFTMHLQNANPFRVAADLVTRCSVLCGLFDTDTDSS